MTARLAIFDCDGTLVDGQADICAAMAVAFTEARLAPPDPHQIRRIVGLSLPAAISRLAPDASPDQQARAIAAYKDAFRAARREGRLAEPLFPGIAPLLAQLHAQGWLLGIATGKSDQGLASCLAMHGLSAYFLTLQTADRHPSKPHPAMVEAALTEAMVPAANAVMIGDTTYDITMAQAAGVRSIGVAWGYHEEDELRKAGAQYVAQTPEHLAELLG